MVNYNPINLSNMESYYRASRFAESFALLGYAITYTPCIEYTLDARGDPTNIEYGEPIQTYMSIVTLNQVTLEKRGWITEDTPIIADLSEVIWSKYLEWKSAGNDENRSDSFLLPITRYSIIEIPYQLDKLGRAEYAVMDIYGDDTRPLVWECRLAPVRNLSDADDSVIGEQLARRNEVGKIGIIDEEGDDSVSMESFKKSNK